MGLERLSCHANTHTSVYSLQAERTTLKEAHTHKCHTHTCRYTQAVLTRGLLGRVGRKTHRELRYGIVITGINTPTLVMCDTAEHQPQYHH